MDTIYALATARGRAGVAILRVSGPRAHDAAASLVTALPSVREAGLRLLRWRGEVLDQALVLLFDAGGSFTGEKVAEFHVHGSVAVVNAVLRALSEMDGLRLAEAGEFTRRAMENGCLDLAQVEGLADLVDAETEAQRRQALRVLSGHVGQRVDAWRARLIRAAALLEATIDFVDEDVPVDVAPEVTALLAGLLPELRREVAGSFVSERIRDGFEVAIVGAPNVGKSTLLNALAGREAAITSEIAGTTRDVIEVRMDLGGLPVSFLDTAGLRETTDRIEGIGISRAIERAERADLRLFLLGADGVPALLPPREGDIVVYGKADLGQVAGRAVSGLTGAGLDELIREITERLSLMSGNAAAITKARHREAIQRAIGAIENAQVEVLRGSDRIEIAAEHLRQALRALDALIGRVDVEDLLDEIFSSFCIGK